MSSEQHIRVLIVDDHPLMREALAGLVETEADMRVVGQAENGQAALRQVEQEQPDVVLMDLYMPVMDGIKATQQIRALYPGTRVLILTSSNEDEKVAVALRSGADGYLLKDSDRVEVLAGIRDVARGKKHLSPEVARKLANAMQMENLNNQSSLTSREVEITERVGQGLNNRQIAEELYITESTVRVHIFNILEKLKLHDRRELLEYAQKQPDSRNSFR